MNMEEFIPFMDPPGVLVSLGQMHLEENKVCRAGRLRMPATLAMGPLPEDKGRRASCPLPDLGVLTVAEGS